MVKGKILIRFFSFFIQFLPLSAFAIYAFWNGEPEGLRWSNAYAFGSILALLQFIIFFFLKRPSNRLILAANLYLLLGGLAVLLKQWWFFQIYGALRESAILLSMSVVGIFTTLFTPAGFIGIRNSNFKKTKQYSFLLLALTFAAFCISFANRGNTLFGATIPIIVLALSNRYFAKRLRSV